MASLRVDILQFNSRTSQESIVRCIPNSYSRTRVRGWQITLLEPRNGCVQRRHNFLKNSEKIKISVDIEALFPSKSRVCGDDSFPQPVSFNFYFIICCCCCRCDVSVSRLSEKSDHMRRFRPSMVPSSRRIPNPRNGSFPIWSPTAFPLTWIWLDGDE